MYENIERTLYYIRELRQKKSLISIGRPKRQTWRVTQFYFVYNKHSLYYIEQNQHIGPTQVKCQLLISSNFDAMNFQHFLEMLEIMLQHLHKMLEIKSKHLT